MNIRRAALGSSPLWVPMFSKDALSLQERTHVFGNKLVALSVG